ncbi:hypothetical protein HGB07_07575 [Candidatus Roizmanbacteria bacterium]|nr:hypothetical protein [Candidatus Roizmanbacteria bacterium]
MPAEIAPPLLVNMGSQSNDQDRKQYPCLGYSYLAPSSDDGGLIYAITQGAVTASQVQQQLEASTSSVEVNELRLKNGRKLLQSTLKMATSMINKGGVFRTSTGEKLPGTVDDYESAMRSQHLN